MSIRRDLENALSSWSSAGDEAFEVADQIFDRIIAIVRTRVPGLTLTEAELMMADAKRATETCLFGLMHNTVHCDVAIDLFIDRFLGGDD